MEIVETKNNANDSFTYIYDNGIKVVYKKIPEPITSVEVNFLGGSSVQGKYMGLAHLTEHSMFLDKKLDYFNGGSNAFTSMNETGFDFLIETTLEDEPPQENKTLNIIKKTLSEWMKKFAKETYPEKENQEEQNLNKIKEAFSIFVEEITNTNFDINNFENEKKIIDQEFNQIKKSENFLSINDFSYNTHTNCGNAKALEYVTPEDVVDYKKKFYTKENMTIFIMSPLEFSSIEPIINSTCENIFSNPETKLKTPAETFEVIDSSSYYINKDSNENTNNEDPSVEVCYVLSNNNSKIDNKTRLIGNVLLEQLLSNNLKTIEYLRINNPLLYTLCYLNYFNTDNSTALEYQFDVVNKNLRRALLSTSKLINNLTTYADDDFFLNFAKGFKEVFESSESIYPYFHINEDLKYDEYNMPKEEFLKYQNEFKEFLSQNQNNPKVIVDELKKCLKQTIDASTISIALSKNANEENLPDINYLENIVKGKVERNLKQDLEPNRTKPVVFDPYKRNLPMICETKPEQKEAVNKYVEGILEKQTKQELLTK